MAKRVKEPAAPDVDVTGLLKRIRVALERRGMSQGDLARTLGVRAATVSEWFTRNRIPHSTVLLRLPSILGVSHAWLFSEEGEASRNADDWRQVSQELRRALSAIRTQCDTLLQSVPDPQSTGRRR